ncbi:hypothetical protein FACS1894168_0870 [Deltaproteobacteria bacterium]|nr:hypothetical protein FACS1894168_0870 [Deltaproteobacteria bacterium]
MSGITPALDHVVISVAENLDAAKEQYRKLGFALTARGHHSHGSSNHLAVFGNNYMELLGYEPQNKERLPSSFIVYRGLSGLAFKTENAEELYHSLHERGIVLEGEPKVFFRPVTLPDGTTPPVHFHTLRLNPAATPNGRVFFCRHLNPGLTYRDEWRSHPNGVVSVARVVIEAADPAKSIRLLRDVFPEDSFTKISGGERLDAGGIPIDYLSPEAAREEFGEHLEPRAVSGDRKIALGLRVRSGEAAMRALTQGGISFKLQEDGRLLVPAQQAFGVVLTFNE